MDWAMKKKGLSQRRACDLAGIDPRIYRYRSTRPGDDPVRERLRELAAERRRFGYRRLHILLVTFPSTRASLNWNLPVGF